MDLSKFTSNKKIFSEVVTLVYKTIIKFVAKFYPKFNYVGPKKNLTKIIKFLKFIYDNYW